MFDVERETFYVVDEVAMKYMVEFFGWIRLLVKMLKFGEGVK